MRINRKRLVAEFFVVMLGVLAALGVDTMVGAVRDAGRARDYRERLAADLRADVFALHSAWAHYSRTNAYGTTALQVLRDEGDDASDQELLALYLAGNIGAAALNTSTWDDLVSSGSLPLLDLDLRTELSSYYRDFSSGPPSWTPPRQYRDRVRSSVPPDVRERLAHATCIFNGIANRAVDAEPDPTPQPCITEVESDEAQQIIVLLRAEPGLSGDLTLLMSETSTMASQFRIHAERAEALAARVES